MILSSYPSIDLHGMDSEYAKFKVNEFINDCCKLKYQQVVIIHGKGTGVLTKTVREYLKKDKRVSGYKLDCFNPGCTIVTLKI